MLVRFADNLESVCWALAYANPTAPSLFRWWCAQWQCLWYWAGRLLDGTFLENWLEADRTASPGVAVWPARIAA